MTTNIFSTLLNQYVMVRTDKAGVFAGTLAKVENDGVELKDARRIWYWEGAASLSELAQKGTSAPSGCRFPQEITQVLLSGVIEIIPITNKARQSIEKVPVWTLHS
jgi:hypothetical protein